MIKDKGIRAEGKGIRTAGACRWGVQDSLAFFFFVSCDAGGKSIEFVFVEGVRDFDLT